MRFIGTFAVIWIYALVECRQLMDRFLSLSSSKQLRKYSDLSKSFDLSIKGDLLRNLLVQRVSGTEGNLKVQYFIKEFFKKLGWDVQEDKFIGDTPHGPIEFNNIIATKDIKAHQKLVLAAHFDSKYFKDFDFIGATDSAAPCAVLMHMAQTLNSLLDKRLKTFDRFSTVQIIFFDGEEAFVEWTPTDSIYGARHLAERWESTMLTMYNEDHTTTQVTPISQIVSLILLDLLGTKDATILNSQPKTQWIWDRLCRIHERLGVLKLLNPFMLKRLKNNNPMFISGPPQFSEFAMQDDHVPFHARGVPITHCIAHPFPQVWHTVDDNADALDEGTLYDLSLTFSILVGEYLGLNDFL